jgi:pimeloyl-ACP methyl ester carboxylesterase
MSHASSTLTRRAAVRLGAGAAAATLAARGLGTAAAQDATPDAEGGRETFVLVHGTWAGAWIWKKVIPLLRAAGHDVYATTATGMGDRIHLADPAITLDTYITDVVNVLEYEELTDVTLVGWSFGGWMITGAAEQVPERLKQLVYLEGAVPQDGQSNYDEATEEGLGFEYQAGVAAGWPGFEVVHAGAEEFVRRLTKDPADEEWLLAKLSPQPMAVSAQPIKLGNPAAAALPRAFILCTEGRGADDPVVAFADQLRSDPGWRVAEVADNHLAPVNAPQLTAEALLSLV